MSGSATTERAGTSELFRRAVERARQIYARHNGSPPGSGTSDPISDHVDRQEALIEETKEMLQRWGIDCDKLKLGLILTDFAKADPDITFNSLLSFKARQFQNLPDTAVKLAMNPVGIELVELIRLFGRVFETESASTETSDLLKRFRGLSNVLLHAEAGRLMVAETVEILAQTKEDLLGESSPDSPTLREAYRLGAEVADQITGHDSFRAGFGKEVIPGALTAMIHRLHELALALPESEKPRPDVMQSLAESVERVAGGLRSPDLYPPSQNTEGFILQILDRLDATEPDTQLRYVREAMAYQGKSITDAITGGIHQNLAQLKKIHAQLIADLEGSRLSAQEQERLKFSPYMKRFERGIADFEHALTMFRAPDGDRGFYRIETGPDSFEEVTGIEDLERTYYHAFARKVAERS